MFLRIKNFLKLNLGKVVHFLIFGFLIYLLFNQGIDLYSRQSSKELPNDYNQEFEKAILWLKDNSRPDDIILSEWTQGHQIIAFANRKVVATSKVYPSEAKETAERYKDIARFFFADSENEALSIVKKYQTNFIFVRKDFDWWTCRYINKCQYSVGTIVDRMLKGDKFNNFLKVYQSPNFLIFKVEGDSDGKLFAGFPEEYLLKIIKSSENQEFLKFNKTSPIYGGILPHHLEYTYPLTADFFKNLATQREIKTFIIFGPDHFNIANSSITTADLLWETPWGETGPDLKILEAITNSGLTTIDNRANEKEYSLKIFIPFIKYYFPKAKVVPLLFKDSIKDEEILKLTEELKRFVSPRVPILVSADFSHRLSLDKTYQEDERILEAIKKFDLSEIKTAEIDTKPGISVLLSIMKELNAENISILSHTNNLDLLKEGIIKIGEKTVPYLVSYFFLTFSR